MSTVRLTAYRVQGEIDQLLKRHGAFVCRTLRLLGIPESDLDDALQEVFLVVFRRLHEYQDQGRVRSWLYAISIRVAGARRRITARAQEELVDYPEISVHPTQHERVVKQEAIDLGRQLLDRLRPEQREVFWLYEVEGLSMPEVARAVACPLQTAYSRLYSARQRLRAEVARQLRTAFADNVLVARSC